MVSGMKHVTYIASSFASYVSVLLMWLLDGLQQEMWILNYLLQKLLLLSCLQQKVGQNDNKENHPPLVRPQAACLFYFVNC